MPNETAYIGVWTNYSTYILSAENPLKRTWTLGFGAQSLLLGFSSCTQATWSRMNYQATSLLPLAYEQVT
jgi:hypothetical protein